MSSYLRKFMHSEKEPEETTFMMRNGEILLRKLIVSFNGKRNPLRSFSVEDLKLATNDYDTQKVTAIDYGVEYELYKGFLEERQITVMKYESTDTPKDCFNNIVFASQMIHKNTLKLMGCCLETQIPTLVFESAEYGSLADRIYRPYQPHFKPLLLTHRLKIAMDIANAVAYLHVGFARPIVFRNIKPSSILFHEQYVAKLFDFSLSKSIPEGETHVKDSVMGDFGFVAPEYLTTGHCNEKSDVYSFGALLLVLFTGQRINCLSHLKTSDKHSLWECVDKYFKQSSVNKIADPVIVRDLSFPGKEQQLRVFTELAFKCLSESAEERPTMIDVAKQLRQMYSSGMQI